MLVCNAYIWAFLYAYICAFVGHILGNKNLTKRERTQVYVAKKPHVYRVIILKQMADHKLPRFNTERFENSYFNRIRFKCNLAI